MRRFVFLIACTIACTAAVASTGCRRRAAPPEPVEPVVVKAIDVRCPDLLLETREGGLDPDRWVAPTESERRALREAIGALLTGRSIEEARAHAKQASFEIVALPDEDALLVREAGKRRGGGAYVVRPKAENRLYVQAPHTFHDEGTLPLACELFARGRAAALFINTAHRYKAAAQTPGGSWPADVAHNRESLFHAATEALVRAPLPGGPRGVRVVQVHGFGEREGTGAIVISGGVRQANHPTVGRIASALSRVIDGGVLRFPDDHPELGATTNVQGSIVRESGGQFLHLEMAAPLRRALLSDPTYRASVLAALADAMEGA